MIIKDLNAKNAEETQRTAELIYTGLLCGSLRKTLRTLR